MATAKLSFAGNGRKADIRHAMKRFLVVLILAGVVAMFAWGGVEPSAERPIHGFGCSEATGFGDLFDGSVGGLQESACGVEPDGFDVVRQDQAPAAMLKLTGRPEVAEAVGV